MTKPNDTPDRGVLGAPTPNTTAIAMSAAAAPLDLPPVGATVTDADGTRWVYPTWRNEDVAPLCLALWRMQQDRDQLKARVAELEALVRDVAYSGVEYDDPRIDYVTVQIDRSTWAEVRNV